MWVYGSFRPLVWLCLPSLFLYVKCVPQSPPVSPPSPSPPPSPPSPTPSAVTPSSKSPSPPPPATSPPSPAPPGTSPAPPGHPLDPQKADIEVQNIFDIIKGDGGDKAAALFEIYDMYPNCVDRLAIEQAYIKSKNNFDKPGDGSEDELSDEDKEKFRLFMGAFLFGCDVAISYAYNMKVLCDKQDSTRGITGSLVACTESPEIQKALQTGFDQRFSKDDDKIFEMITEAVGENDTKNVCGSLLNIYRSSPLDKPDEAIAKQTIDDLLKEEKESEGWADSREVLDNSLLGQPLNQCQYVVEKFSKDGKKLIEVFKEDFKDKEEDEDKFTVYSQIVEYVTLNVTFFGDELKYGLEKKDARFPMRILAGLKQKTMFTEIEASFAGGASLRDQIKVVTTAPEADYPGKFFDMVFEKEYGNQNSAPQQLAAAPAADSPPSPPSPSTPPPSISPPPASPPPASPPPASPPPASPPPLPKSPPPATSSSPPSSPSASSSTPSTSPPVPPPSPPSTP